jgi:hypothetical protein
MKIISKYEHLFYIIVSGLDKIPPYIGGNEWTAVFVLSLLMFSNLGSIYVVGQIFTGEVFFHEILRTLVILLIISLILIHYFLFIHGKKYPEIMKRFKNESIESRKIGIKYAAFYILGSFLFFIFLNMVKVIIWGK